MGRKKNFRYNDVMQLKNVFLSKIYKNEVINLPTIWDHDFFNSRKEIVLELGCGKGAYTVNLAKKYQEKTIIGVDIKSDRIWYGAKECQNQKIDNAFFLKTRIDHLETFFNKNTISEIWITFPDPYLTEKNKKKRLTSPRFLNIYRNVLKDNRSVHLKTDNAELYNYSAEMIDKHAHIIKKSDDLYHSDIDNEDIISIQTPFEKKFLSKNIPIKYLEFGFNSK